MEIEYLVTVTYSAAILFMVVLLWGIGFIATLRRMRLQSQEPVRTGYPAKLQNS